MTMHGFVLICQTFHVLYYNVWLCVTLDDPLFHCMTMFDSGRLNWTLYDSAWPCIWLCITLYDSEWFWMTLFESVSLTWDPFWLYYTLFHSEWERGRQRKKERERLFFFKFRTFVKHFQTIKIFHMIQMFSEVFILFNKSQLCLPLCKLRIYAQILCILTYDPTLDITVKSGLHIF